MARLEKPVDVVIVGVGWTGGIMAKELTRAGLTVVGLERGSPPDDAGDFARISSHDELANRRGRMVDLSQGTVTVRNAASETARPMRWPGAFTWPEGVGGAGNYWATACYRLAPWDFRLRSNTIHRYGAAAMPEGCTSQDWPLTFEELEPYYDRFERDIGVSGQAGNLGGKLVQGGNPFEGPRSRDYPNPPAPSTDQQKIFEKAARSLGYHPYPAPGATMTRAYTNPEGVSLGPCVYCGHCSGYLCEMNAKATPVATVLPTALKSGRFDLRTNAMVTRIDLDSTGRRATGVTYVDAGGQEVEQPADIVILAGFTFANVRMLLISRIGEPYDPVTGRGHVGRNYTWHNQAPDATLFFDHGPVFNTFMGSGSLGTRMSDLQGDNFDHSGLGFIGGASMGAMIAGEAALSGGPTPPGTPAFGSAWKKAAAHYYSRFFRITSLHDCQSHRANFLDLDPNYRDRFGLPLLRVTYDNQPNERAAVAHCTGKLAEIAKAAGADHVAMSHLPEHFDVGEIAGGSKHQSGGAVMGSSPGDSVVNSHLQVWGTPNLFVVGASAFPQLAGCNPTMTAGAITYRAAEAIVSRYIKSPGLIA